MRQILLFAGYSSRSASTSAVLLLVFSSFILMMRAGTPATTAFSGTSCVTTCLLYTSDAADD